MNKNIMVFGLLFLLFWQNTTMPIFFGLRRVASVLVSTVTLGAVIQKIGQRPKKLDCSSENRNKSRLMFGMIFARTYTTAQNQKKQALSVLTNFMVNRITAYAMGAISVSPEMEAIPISSTIAITIPKPIEFVPVKKTPIDQCAKEIGKKLGLPIETKSDIRSLSYDQQDTIFCNIFQKFMDPNDLINGQILFEISKECNKIHAEHPKINEIATKESIQFDDIQLIAKIPHLPPQLNKARTEANEVLNSMSLRQKWKLKKSIENKLVSPKDDLD